jgi:7,8-dihydropterin-6-yl-methyl-4-(beta-D-ribofuranosyl)aminobenzene 5'-phosphate synthase
VTKIKVVVDNIAKEPYLSEHGYSVYIEHRGNRVLFDTAQGEAFLHNTKEMGIDIYNLDYLVLSHGHYDHGGNIAPILNSSSQVVFVAHPNCTVPRYSLHDGKPVKSTALTNENKSAIINHHHSKIKWSFGATEVCDSLWVTGEIPRVSPFEDTGGPFYLDREKRTPDLLPDDMALFIDNGDDLTVICGCCHSGVVNTLEHIKSINSKCTVFILIIILTLLSYSKKFKYSIVIL